MNASPDFLIRNISAQSLSGRGENNAA